MSTMSMKSRRFSARIAGSGKNVPKLHTGQLLDTDLNASDNIVTDLKTDDASVAKISNREISTSSDSHHDSESSDSDVESVARNIGDKLRDMMNSSQLFEYDSSDSENNESDEASSPMKFIIDKSGNQPNKKDVLTSKEDSEDSESISDSEDDVPPMKPKKTVKAKPYKKQAQIIGLLAGRPVYESDQDEYSGEDESVKLSSNLQSSIDPDKLVYIQTDIYEPRKVKNPNLTDLMLKSSQKGSELLKKSVITTDFEKKAEINPYRISDHQLKKQYRSEKSKTNGEGWFDMVAPEMTAERKNDLQILRMRNSLNPKQFYKAPDIKALPKFFQMGRVIESAADFYHSRIPKKQRKKTLVEELMADADFRRYNKRKYAEIQESKTKYNKGKYKHMKRLKKKKK